MPAAPGITRRRWSKPNSAPRALRCTMPAWSATRSAIPSRTPAPWPSTRSSSSPRCSACWPCNLAVDLTAKQGAMLTTVLAAVFFAGLGGLRIPQLLQHAHREQRLVLIRMGQGSLPHVVSLAFPRTMEPGPGHMNTISSQPAVDPAVVPQRTLYTGARMPAIGLGTFGSDHVTADEIAAAVEGAAAVRLPPLRLRQRLPQRRSNRLRSAGAVGRGHPARGTLDHQQTLERQARRSRRHPCLPAVPGRPAARLSGHVPGPLAVPQFPSAGVRRQLAQSRRRPYIHENFMKTWRQMEKLVDLGLVRHIGTSNMTIPKLDTAAARRAHPTRRQRNGDASAFPADRTVPIPCAPTASSRSPTVPIGSPGRPERDRTPDDTVDIEDPVIVAIAQRLGVHPAVVCVKWAAQRGATPIPFSINRAQLPGQPSGRRQRAADRGGHGARSRRIDRNCRLIKGQVFLWKQDQTWEDLWDLDGVITGNDRRVPTRQQHGRTERGRRFPSPATAKCCCA